MTIIAIALIFVGAVMALVPIFSRGVTLNPKDAWRRVLKVAARGLIPLAAGVAILILEVFL